MAGIPLRSIPEVPTTSTLQINQDALFKLSAALFKLSAALQIATQQTEALVQQADEHENERIAGILDRILAKLDEKQSTAITLKDAVQELRAEVQQTRVYLRDATRPSPQPDSHIVTLDMDNLRVNSANGQRHSFVRANAPHIEVLQAENTQLRAILLSQMSLVDSHNRLIKHLESEKEHLRSDVRDAKLEAEHRQTLSTESKNMYTAQVQRASSDAAEHGYQLRAVGQERDNYIARLQEAKDQAQRAEQRLRSLEEEKDMYLSQSQAERVKAEFATHDFEEMKYERDALRAQLVDAEDAKEIMQMKSEHYEEQFWELSNENVADGKIRSVTENDLFKEVRKLGLFLYNELQEIEKQGGEGEGGENWSLAVDAETQRNHLVVVLKRAEAQRQIIEKGIRRIEKAR